MKELLIFLLPVFLFGQPNGLCIQEGSAALSKKGKELQIKNSPSAILHWEDFSIGPGERVHFAQECAQSTVLNRVTSQKSSQLLGHLTSNGFVFLINPNGILIGADGVVETGGFLASTANISNENFLKGHYLFSDPSIKGIENQGVIRCPKGDVYLVARTITNPGTIEGESTALVSAKEVLITPHAQEKVFIRFPLEEKNVSSLEEELSIIHPYEKAIRHSGSIATFSTEEKEGKIYLIAEKGIGHIEGRLEAPGGAIEVAGKEIYVTESATVDVSGKSGGTLSIGKNSDQTTIEKGATLTANGKEGNGGIITIWSEGETFCAATISAAALGSQGDGGFLEISGRKTAEAPLIPTLSSVSGKVGTFLIDPGSITITSGSSPGTGGIYGVTYLQGLLASSHVTLNTGSESIGPETLTITNLVTGANALSWTSNFDLELIAGRNIEVQSGAQINFSGAGTFSATALGSIAGQTQQGILINGLTLSATGAGNIFLNGTGGDTGTGNEGILIQGSTNISVNSGTLTLVGNGGNASHGVSITNGILQTTFSGTVDITGNGGSGALTDGIRLSGSGVDILAPVNGSISLTGNGGGSGTGSHGISMLSAAQVRPAGSSSLTINGTASPSANGGVGIYMSGSNSLITVVDGPMALNAEGGGTGDNNIGISIPLNGITATGSGNITINAKGTATGGNNNLGISIPGDGAIQLAGGDLSITALGSDFSGPGSGNIGIQMLNFKDWSSTQEGSINIFATGGSAATGGGNIGLSMTSGITFYTSRGISAPNGNIAITAIGSPLGSNNIGMLINNTTNNSAGRLEVNAGQTLTITARGGGPGSGSGNIGLATYALSSITSGGSGMIIDAIGYGIGGNCIGMDLRNSINVLSAGTMDITAIGSPDSSSSSNNVGLNFHDFWGYMSTTTGAMTFDVTGASNATGSGNIGLSMASSITYYTDRGIHSTSGDISIKAIGSPVGSNNNRGVFINNTSNNSQGKLLIETGGLLNFINPTGAGVNSGSGNVGVWCGRIGAIRSLGNFPLTFRAVGQGLGDNCIGLYVEGELSANSDLDVTAIGSEVGTTGSNHFGIAIHRGTISSTSSSVQLTARGSTSGGISGGGHVGIGVPSGGGMGYILSSTSMTLDAVGALNGTGSGNIGLSMTNGPTYYPDMGITSISGDILITAVGSPLGSDDNRGIFINNTSNNSAGKLKIESGRNLEILARGGGSGSGSRNIGIAAHRYSSITSAGSEMIIDTIGYGVGGNCIGMELYSEINIFSNGTMDITAIGSPDISSSSGNIGFRFYNFWGYVSTTTQPMRLIGIGGSNATGSGNIGLSMTSSMTYYYSRGIKSSSGDISITAIGAPLGSDNNGGISMNNTSNNSAGRLEVISGGNLTVSATSGGSGNSNVGLLCNRYSTIGITGGSPSGYLNISAVGEGNGSQNRGFFLTSNGIINSVDGALIIEGTGGLTSGIDNQGIYMNSTSAQITSQDGAISLIGNGGYASSGIHVTGGVINATGTGTIASTGTGGDGGGAPGILFTGSGTDIFTAGGNISLTGTGGGTGSSGDGMQLLSQASISAGGNGSIILTGTGSPSLSGTGGMDGILMSGSGTLVSSNLGDIILNGTGGAQGDNNNGLRVEGSADVVSTGGIIRGNSFGGTGGSGCSGVLVTGSGSTITATNGGVDLTGTGGGTTTSNQGILVSGGGQIRSTAGASLQLTGTGGPGTSSNHGIKVSGSSSYITTPSGNIDLIGQGGGNTQDNRGINVDTSGKVTSTSGIITATGTGGSGTTGCFGILVDGASAQILSSTGTVDLIGTGAGSGANNSGVRISNGATINTNSTNITLIGNGSTIGSDNNYGIELLSGGLSTTTGNITLTGNGGGTGTENRGIYFMSPGGNITTTSGAITINATGSSNGTDQCLGLLVDGIEITSIAGSIDITAAGQGSGVTNPGVLIQNGGKITSDTAPIAIRATGSLAAIGSSEGIKVSGGEISSTSGAVTLEGTKGNNTLEGITLENQGRVFTSGTLNITTFSDLLITTDSSIESQGTNPANFNIATDLRILGGAGVGEFAFISLADGTGNFTIGRDLLLQGGSGGSSFAQIGNTTLLPSATAPMTFDVAGNVTLTGAPNDGYALIGHGSLKNAQDLSGNITFTNAQGDIILTGDSVGGFAQVGHLDYILGGSSIGGDIFLSCRGDLNVVGGTEAAGYARVGHGGQMGSAIYTPFTMELIAGRDINITSGLGEAEVVNENGPLTLVVDDLFPTAPDIGPGAFRLNSLLSAPNGELRIYTAVRAQNEVNDLVNGQVFVPVIYDVNTPTEEWSIYYPDGSYEGADFRFYYKEPKRPPPLPLPSQSSVFRTYFADVSANLVELIEVLPTLKRLRAPSRFPNYHFKVCEEDLEEKECRPNFSPYGSFIFEDDLWWIGKPF